MSTERFKNVTSFVINLLNNKTIMLLNLAECRLSIRRYSTLFRRIIIVSIYTLSDLGVLSNLIGSLSLANEHYSPTTE